MPTAMTSTELALLHHLETAAEGDGQLPKHVAHDLEQEGLVEPAGQSPGNVILTEAGLARLQLLRAARQLPGDVLP